MTAQHTHHLVRTPYYVLHLSSFLLWIDHERRMSFCRFIRMTKSQLTDEDEQEVINWLKVTSTYILKEGTEYRITEILTKLAQN